MSYLNNGFNGFLQKDKFPSAQAELSEADASTRIVSLTGTSVAGGVTKSQSGKVQIDWEKGQILVGDGANWRVLIGDDGL